MLLTAPKSCWLHPAIFVATMACSPVEAMDHVTLRRDGQTVYVEGRIVLTAQDGGLLFLARDGALWRMLPTELVKHASDDAPFRAYPTEQMKKSVLADLPRGFRVYEKAAHYLIFYDTSPAYAQWCGALFEGLYKVFRNTWSQRGFQMGDPEFRLVAIIFADKPSYVKYSKKELGDAADSIFGYYNMESNRMIMYDLVGPAVTRPGQSVGPSHISQFLASPNAYGAACTIVHEATHQIAFNSGLQQRLSDCPKWFSEGIAMYFETPDLGRTISWGRAGVGTVNGARLAQFQQYLKHRPANSLKTLIGSGDRLVDVKQADDAYAESWALTYYLIQMRQKEYIAYLKVLSRKRPLEVDEKATQLAEFEKQFGPLEKLDGEFLNYYMLQKYKR